MKQKGTIGRVFFFSFLSFKNSYFLAGSNFVLRSVVFSTGLFNKNMCESIILLAYSVSTEVFMWENSNYSLIDFIS